MHRDADEAYNKESHGFYQGSNGVCLSKWHAELQGRGPQTKGRWRQRGGNATLAGLDMPKWLSW